ncbi:hypothetical protein M430DRAFT_276706 [Amorphotheca resinae ATCC 22711]|uniref:Uncharacterized protein n=1 Tax=Amorphotheca resinae ATCC 22711 TaxID=857342 RepID=A0A2T3B0G3_AMORE|nr:hypothetical protein M430DRAFT_276706 [Amorphotheca resinae ATCC 22711]PSS16890.1 hypothetical protein M430DRAFT_276706 [Amorphotheca resinae ATCC 22711]
MLKIGIFHNSCSILRPHTSFFLPSAVGYSDLTSPPRLIRELAKPEALMNWFGWISKYGMAIVILASAEPHLSIYPALHTMTSYSPRDRPAEKDLKELTDESNGRLPDRIQVIYDAYLFLQEGLMPIPQHMAKLGTVFRHKVLPKPYTDAIARIAVKNRVALGDYAIRLMLQPYSAADKKKIKEAGVDIDQLPTQATSRRR